MSGVSRERVRRPVGELPGTSPAVFALRGCATVVVGDGIVLENAAVVLNDGLVEAVGPTTLASLQNA